MNCLTAEIRFDRETAMHEVCNMRHSQFSSYHKISNLHTRSHNLFITIALLESRSLLKSLLYVIIEEQMIRIGC